MKKLSLPLLISALIAQPSGAELVPNGEFEMYKPGTNYTVTATFGVGNSFAQGVGDGIELKGGTVIYSDGSPDGVTGDGIPDIDLPGWAPLQSGNDLFGNGVDGSNGMNLFAAWGGDGRIQSADPLGIIESNNIYTISVLVGGPDSGPIQGPLAFHLVADGVQLTPSEVVDPTLPNGGAFQEISRTYDADSIAGHIGAEMTIVLGVEDANDFANRVVFDNVSMEVVYTGPPPRLPLAITPSGTDLSFAWESQPGMYYTLQTSPDLAAELPTWESVNVPGSVENGGVFEIATNPPLNRHTIARPVADPTRFYRVQEFPLPPVTVLDENFDTTTAGLLPAGWTTGFDASDTLMNTSWGLGDPAGTSAGIPATANTVPNCVGTNLTTAYGTGSNTWLRSSPIDLTAATAATLTFWQSVDIDPGVGGSFGTVRVLNSGSLAELAVVATDIANLDLDGWVEFSMELPPAALGQSVLLEFSFVSDGDNTLGAGGWYIDDLTVVTPAP